MLMLKQAPVEPSSRLISRPTWFGRTGLNGAAGCDAPTNRYSRGHGVRRVCGNNLM